MNREVQKAVKNSLTEDVGSGDLSAQLIHETTQAHAELICQESAVLCGIPWFEEVFRQQDPSVILQWQAAEGERIAPGQCILKISGLARSIVTAERSALNWLQTLSGTATQVAQFVEQLQGTRTRLLDTRKTIPGLRYAQKYAVRVGGGVNHRMGLYDAYLIKENHIASCGSIQNAVAAARQKNPGKMIEVEVENLNELSQALAVKVERVMLDNFNIEMIREAVLINQHQAELEVSGNVELATIRAIAETGVDYISVGGLTKHVHAIDFSMRIRAVESF